MLIWDENLVNIEEIFKYLDKMYHKKKSMKKKSMKIKSIL
jgi:hypothetical protein